MKCVICMYALFFLKLFDVRMNVASDFVVAVVVVVVVFCVALCLCVCVLMFGSLI